MPKSIGASAANPQTAAAQFAPTAPKPAAMPTPGSNTQNDIRSPKLNAPAGGSGLATLSQTSTSTAQPATPTLATAPAPATAQSAQPQPPQVNDPAQQARMAERAAKQQAFDANMQAIGGRVAALDKRIAESSMTGQELAKSRGVDLSAEYNPHSGTTYAKSNPTQQELLVHDRLRQGLSAEGAKAQYDKGVAATQAARAAGTDELRKRVQPWQPTAEQMSGVPEDELVSLSKGTVLRPGSYEEFVRNEPGLQKAIEALPPEQSQNGMALASEYAKRRLGQLQAAKSYFAHPNTWHESRDWTKPGLKEYAQEHGLRPDQYADALYRNQGEVEASQSDPQLSIMGRGLDNITRWTLPTPKPAEGATEQSSLLPELAAQTRAQGTGSNPFSAIRQTAGELNPDHRLSGPVADAVKTRTQMENLEGGREGMPLDPATWNPLRPLRDAVVKHVTGRDSRMPTDASLKPGYWETAGNNLPSIPAVPGQDFSQAGQTIGDVADLAGRGVADVGRMAGGGLGGAATMIPATAASLGHVGKNFFKEVYDSATGAPRTSVADQTAGFARRLTNRIQDDPSIKYWQAMPDRYWEAANAGYRDLKGLMPPESGTPEAEAAHRAHMAAFDKLISEGHSVNDAANLLRAKGLQQLKANNPVAEDDAKSIELAGKVSPQAARTTKQLLNAGDYAAKAIPLVATGNWAAARGLPLAGAFSSMSNFNSGAGAAQRAAAPVVGAALDQMPGVRNTLANSDAAAAVGAGAGLYPFGRMGLDLINKVLNKKLLIKIPTENTTTAV